MSSSLGNRMGRPGETVCACGRVEAEEDARDDSGREGRWGTEGREGRDSALVGALGTCRAGCGWREETLSCEVSDWYGDASSPGLCAFVADIRRWWPGRLNGLGGSCCDPCGVVGPATGSGVAAAAAAVAADGRVNPERRGRLLLP